MSGSLDFTNQYIQETYKRVVQTQDGFLYDGTGSLINNVSIPGDLYVSGTLYAENTVTVTQSYYSGSNIFGDELTDTHQFTGSVSITGSLTTVGPTVTTGSIETTDNIIIANNKSLKGRATSGYTVDLVNINTYNQTVIGNTAGPLVFIPGGVPASYFTSTGLGLFVTNPTARLHIKGAGTTSATTALLVQNANASASLQVTDNQVVQLKELKSFAADNTPGYFRLFNSSGALTRLELGRANSAYIQGENYSNLYSFGNSLNRVQSSNVFLDLRGTSGGSTSGISYPVSSSVYFSSNHTGGSGYVAYSFNVNDTNHTGTGSKHLFDLTHNGSSVLSISSSRDVVITGSLEVTGSITGDIFLVEHDPELPATAVKGQIYFTSDGRLYIGI